MALKLQGEGSHRDGSKKTNLRIDNFPTCVHGVFNQVDGYCKGVDGSASFDGRKPIEERLAHKTFEIVHVEFGVFR